MRKSSQSLRRICPELRVPIPNDGLDTKAAAMRVHSLAKSLNVDRARVVGHKGEHVIVSGAAGSVGQAAIQMRG